MLKLKRPSGNTAFLSQVEVLGRNILHQPVQDGWFVPRLRHVSCCVANDESQALVHMAASLMGRLDAAPAFTGALPVFHAMYGMS